MSLRPSSTSSNAWAADQAKAATLILNVSNVAKSFGAKPVLKGASFRLESREKAALVGRNGSGKTTLLKIVEGSLDPDQGSVHRASGITVGYLSQVADVDPSLTVLQAAEGARRHLVEVEARMKDLEGRMDAGLTEPEIEEYALLHEHFVEGGGYSVERDITTVLKRMGFAEDEFEKPVSALSGGQRTRLMLGQLLLEEPELLILDEPTNHLDLEATEWLESWLKGYGGAVMMVSHDRTFLNNVATRILELKEGAIKTYPGPFEKFIQLRKEEDARLAEVVKRQQIQMDKLDDFVRRFMNSERTAQARGRLRHLNTLRGRAVESPKEEKGMKAGFAKAKRSGDLVIETRGLSMAFGAERLFQGLNWTVKRGERWGVIGANGIGKSTLVKIILNELQPTSGQHKLGANVHPGYFSQDASDIDLESTPLMTLHLESGLDLEKARNLLGRMLFHGDEVFQSNRSLSGGERNKLALAQLVADEPNLLILDEPTNHLDMASREALADVLKSYTGTLVLISHDRWLLGEITDRTLDLRRDGPRIYPGSYEEYRAAQASRSVVGQAPLTVRSEAPQPVSQTPRELSKEIQRLIKSVAEREQEVHRLEMEIERMETIMAAPPAETDHYGLSIRHGDAKADLETAFESWVHEAAKLDQLRELQRTGVA